MIKDVFPNIKITIKNRMKIGVINEYKNCSFDYLCNRTNNKNASNCILGLFFLAKPKIQEA